MHRASAGARLTHFYIMAFVLALTAFGATWLLLRSRFGLGLTAMRDNEEAAGSAGVNLTFPSACSRSVTGREGMTPNAFDFGAGDDTPLCLAIREIAV
jgi:ABC-type uncharacterized transport system permease subunit